MVGVNDGGGGVSVSMVNGELTADLAPPIFRLASSSKIFCKSFSEVLLLFAFFSLRAADDSLRDSLSVDPLLLLPLHRGLLLPLELALSS